MTRIVLGISGASGIPLAVRTAESIAAHAELIVVVTDAAESVMAHEGPGREETMAHLDQLATAVYHDDEITASVASGSVDARGMAIVPASMHTVAAVADGHADGLLTRAADVCLKEDRPLVVVPRETPMSEIHLGNLERLAGVGASVVPPVLGFYYEPDGIDDVLDHLAGKVLDRFDIEHSLGETWSGDGRL
ncbi:UbiX family flavin prenyltransferase [Halococcoides cellulosivorans]|uniref:Flavin prenyltransferase UbiX n=1 Tax=Halococcoides cellulosivorans TaxID=1679096 RepID=A0A2R4WYS6_9EURY|nr:UbiX family flavin prenyltransferase [Halococcoides cellulosivorans]AWB26688.1 3-octaprenyl-4-hydroxybenzoate carboxy-lyase [Halococcoides cellulosivorans]